MRSFTSFVIAALVLSMGFTAYAELQNVEVGGSIRIRGTYYNMDDAWNYDDESFVEQRTRLNVKADFTDNVSAFIELESWDVWGEDFRSVDYVTGVDTRQDSRDDVEIYQGYIEMNEIADYPLSIRVGRQELALGNQWLVGLNDSASYFRGLSFDGVLISYATDMVAVHGMWMKLAETFGDFSEDDVDLYGVYGSYLGLEDVTIDAYWIYIEDDIPLIGGGTVDHHTVGLRGAGAVGAFDFEAEVAYQFGDVDMDDVDLGAWGGNVELGYTFDVAWMPRPYLGFAYLEGMDDDDLAFNRLFSNVEYTEFLTNTDMSNALIYRAGIGVMPTECLALQLTGAYFEADEEADLGWCRDADDDIGWEVGLYADYQYSEDLVIRAGWAHFFAEDGLEDGNLITQNGLAPWVGDEDDDYDYLFIETELRF
jgi:hypothetical protein